MQRRGVGRAFEAAVWAAAAVAALYLIVGAYCGYALGRAMHEAKAGNPLIAVVADAIGRQRAERVAIVRSRLPGYLVNAPTFWIALRLNE
jgi:membrane protein YqaA with SNARE-associated domain